MSNPDYVAGGAPASLEEQLPLWKLQEAAEYLKVAPNTLRNWHKRGEIEWFTLPGGHIRIPDRELRRLLEVQA